MPILVEAEKLHSVVHQRLTHPNIIDPSNPKIAQEQLEHTTSMWRGEGFIYVLAMGAFDLLHDNHFAALVFALTAATLHATQTDLDEFVSMNTEEQNKILDRGRLIVSVDGDSHVKRRKSGKTIEGKTARPVQPWEVRARAIAGLSRYRTDNGYIRPLVDITIGHGVDYGRPFKNQWQLIKLLRPDYCSVAEDDPHNHSVILRLNTSKTIVVPRGRLPYKFDGKAVSTSGMIERIIASAILT